MGIQAVLTRHLLGDDLRSHIHVIIAQRQIRKTVLGGQDLGRFLFLGKTSCTKISPIRPPLTFW